MIRIIINLNTIWH